MAQSIYVDTTKNGALGTFSEPFNSLTAALLAANNGDIVVLMNNSYDIATENENFVFPAKTITIKPMDSTKCRIMNYNKLSCINSTIAFENLSFLPRTNSDRVFQFSSSVVNFKGCSFGFNASTCITLDSSAVKIDSCDFNMLAENFNKLFEIKSYSSLVCSGSKFTNFQSENVLFELTAGMSELKVSSCTFDNASTPVPSINAMIEVVPDGVNNSCTLDLNYNTFTNVPFVLNIPEGQAITFRKMHNTKELGSAIIAKNYFINSKRIINAGAQCLINFYNNTVFNCRYGIAAINSAQVKIINSIFAYLDEYPQSAGELPIGYPSTAYAVFANDNGSATISYSDFTNETDIFFDDGNSGTITKGAYIRYVDPVFMDEPTYNLRLNQSSPLLGIGLKSELPYLTSYVNIGASEDVAIDLSDYDLLSIKNRVRETNVAIGQSKINVSAYLIARLKEEFPNLSIDTGSVTGDLLIKFLSTALQPLASAIENTFLNQSLVNAEFMTESAVDDLLYNVFVFRKEGRKAFGALRFYFYNPIDFDIEQDVLFSHSLGYAYRVIVATTYTETEIAKNYDDIKGMFFADVLIESVFAGSIYNTSEKTITISESELPSTIASFVNVEPITGGADRETNVELINRAKKSVTVRNLVNAPSIYSQLTSEVSGIIDTLSVGKGETEMLRDIIEPMNIHMGGCIDVYVRTANVVETSFIIGLADSSAQVKMLPVSYGYNPILYIKSVEELSMPSMTTKRTLDPSLYSYQVLDKSLRYSGMETLLFSFDASLINKTLRVNVATNYDIKFLSEYMNNTYNRVICFDTIAKSFTPVLLSVACTGSGTGTIVKQTIIDTIKRLIWSNTVTSSITAQEINNVLMDNGLTMLTAPTELTAKVYNTSDSKYTTINSTTLISVDRTSRFIPDEITVNIDRRN